MTADFSSELISIAQPGLLACSDLSWHADQQVILKHINLLIRPGSFTGLIGPNGAGKSSLLRCLYRYHKPSHGEVLFSGEDIWQLAAQDYAKQVAVVLQESPGDFNLSVSDVVALGLVPYKTLFSISTQTDKDKIRQAIAQVGLADKAEQLFDHLSGGEKQRALIARAIVQSPQLLIMDEPTSHLDIKYQIQIMELARSLKITVLASFHDLNLASAICDELIVLNHGEVVAQGSPVEVISETMLSNVFGVCAKVQQHPQQAVPHITYFYGYQPGSPIKGSRHD